MSDGISIAIFAKAPIAGFAKTRLVPILGAKGAADLQHQMIVRTVQIALASEVGPVSLWCAPSCGHALFSSLATAHAIELHAQSGTDLGARMLNAFERLTDNGPVILIGTDCPMLQAIHLIDCARLLREAQDIVILPTEDGGYALLGATGPWGALFRDMPWGTDRVMPETRLRAQQVGLRLLEPALLWDVDTPADYERAATLGLLDLPGARSC